MQRLLPEIKMTGTTTVCDFPRAVKSCLHFDVLMLKQGHTETTAGLTVPTRAEAKRNCPAALGRITSEVDSKESQCMTALMKTCKLLSCRCMSKCV